MAEMTARRVYREVGGKEAFNGMLERIRKAHGLKVLSTDESTDNEGHSAAMVLFGYDNDEKNVDAAFKQFDEALSDVIYLLNLFDLNLRHECNGDGDGCILVSYRIY